MTLFKNLFTRCIAALVAIAPAVAVAPSDAALVYSFSQMNFEVAPDATVNVDVFLLQTSPGPVDISIDGIVSGGVRVSFDANAPSDAARVLSLSDIVPNPAFDASIPPDFDLVAGSSAGFVDSVGLFSPNLTGNNIFLGTFVFTAGSVPGEVTSLVATDFNVQSDDFLGGDIFFTPLDSMIGNGFATITVVSAIPEPSSLAVLACVPAVLCLRRRRQVRAAS